MLLNHLQVERSLLTDELSHGILPNTARPVLLLGLKLRNKHAPVQWVLLLKPMHFQCTLERLECNQNDTTLPLVNKICKDLPTTEIAVGDHQLDNA